MITRLLIVLCSLWGGLSCSDRQRLNPLDPEAPQLGESLGHLVAMAGDRRVDLSWDYSSFSDIEGYLLYRREVGGAFALLAEGPLPAKQKAYSESWAWKPCGTLQMQKNLL